MRKILLFSLTFLFFVTISYAQEPSGSIIFISGKEYKTRVKGSKEWVINTSDSVLKSGVRIKTDENTSLRVVIKDRFIIFVPADSDINFTEIADNEETITILKGNILITTLSAKIKGIINTPTSEIIREKPTSMIIKVNSQDGTTEIFVLENEVSVKNLIQSDNNYKLVKQGTYSKILPQVLPTEPSQFRLNDLEETIKKIKTPISTGSVKMTDENIFDRFIEDFQFDPFFVATKQRKSACKEIYTSPNIPVDFEKNLIYRNTNLVIDVK